MADIEVGNLRAQISLDDNETNKTLAELTREVKVAQSEFKKAAAEVEGFGKGTDGLKAKADALTKTISAQQALVNKLRTEHEKAAREKGEDAKQTQNMEVRLNKAAAELARLQNELRATNTELEKQTSAWSKVSAAVDSFADKAEKVGQRMAKVGTELTWSISAPLTAIGGLASKASIEYESAFAGVRKTVDATEEELAQLSRSIRDMSKEIPAAATEIAAVAEAAGQLGIATPNIMSFTRTMIDLGEATNLSSEQAATALARLANITQMPQTEFDRLGSTIVALGNNLATTESEIVEMALRLAGAGTTIGLTEAQILALAGALSSVGIEAEAGGSALSKVMVNIASVVAAGGKDLENFAGVAGYTADQFKQAFQRDAAGAIIAFVEGLGKIQQTGGNVFGVLEALGLTEVRLRDALLRAAGAGDLFRESLELGAQAWEENIALANEAAQRYATSESQLSMLKNRVTDAAVTLGDALVPALMSALDSAKPIIDSVQRMAEGFSNLDESTQRTIIMFGAVAAAAGPVIIVAGKLVTSIGAITTAVRGLGTAMTLLAANPVGLALTAIAATATMVTTSMIKAKVAAEELRQAQEEYQRVLQQGIEQHEIEVMEEKRQKLEELRDKYIELIELAKNTNEASAGNNLAALANAGKELGYTIEKLAETAWEFDIQLEAVDENGQLATVSLGKLEEQIKTYTRAVADAKRETTEQINASAQRLAAQYNEIAVVESLIQTYRNASRESEEWKNAQAQLSQMFPQFTTAVGLNAEAIEGLMIVKRREIEQAWENIRVKAEETKAVKLLAEAQLTADMYAYAMTDPDEYKQRLEQLKEIRAEIAALNALINSGPGDFSIQSFTPGTPIAPVKEEKTKTAYQNKPLEEAYRLLEHKKRLDQLSLESELQMLESIKLKHVKTAEERMTIEEKLYDVRKRIAEQAKDREAELLDEAVRKYRAATEDRIVREQLTADEQFRIQKQMHDNIIRDNEAYLQRVLEDSRYTAEEKARIEAHVTETIRQNINDRLRLEQDYYESVRREQIDAINSLSQGIQAALRERYTAEKNAGEQALREQLEANEKWRRETIDSIKTVTDYRIKAAEQAAEAEIARINQVYGARIEAIQAELDALDRAEKERTRAEQDAEDEKKVARLRARMEYERDEYNRTQIQKEIDKILAEQAKRHEKEQLEDKKDALKEEQKSLQDKLREETQAIKDQLTSKKDLIKQEQDAQIASINFVAEQKKKSLEADLVAHQQHYANLLLARNLQAEAEKMIIQNQQKEILALLNDFGEDYNRAGRTLGEEMYEGFAAEVNKIQALINQIQAQIAAARAAAMSAMASAGSSAGGSTANTTTNITVQNSFNAPVTSPSDVARATQKTAQQLALGL